MEGKIVGMYLDACFCNCMIKETFFRQLFFSFSSIYCEKKFHSFLVLCYVNSYTSIDNFGLEVWPINEDICPHSLT